MRTLIIADEDAYLGAALIALLRSMVRSSKAIVTLCGARQPHAAKDLLRPMFEARIEIAAILAGPDQRANAIRYTAFAIFEMMRYMTESGIDPAEFDSFAKRIEELRKVSPEAVASVEPAPGTARKMYWTGKSRKALLRQLYPNHPGMVSAYTSFSWDAHQILTGVLDVELDLSGEEPHLKFGPRETWGDAEQFAVQIAQNILGDAWAKVIRVLSPQFLGDPADENRQPV